MQSQVSAWCSKAHPRSWCLKGHTDSVDVSGGSGAGPEWKKTERKKIIQIYVFMYRYGVTPKTSSKIAFLTAFHIPNGCFGLWYY